MKNLSNIADGIQQHVLLVADGAAIQCSEINRKKFSERKMSVNIQGVPVRITLVVEEDVS